jgi:hypothetical protein
MISDGWAGLGGEEEEGASEEINLRARSKRGVEASFKRMACTWWRISQAMIRSVGNGALLKLPRHVCTILDGRVALVRKALGTDESGCRAVT